MEGPLFVLNKVKGDTLGLEFVCDLECNLYGLGGNAIKIIIDVSAARGAEITPPYVASECPRAIAHHGDTGVVGVVGNKLLKQYITPLASHKMSSAAEPRDQAGHSLELAPECLHIVDVAQLGACVSEITGHRPKSASKRSLGVGLGLFVVVHETDVE